MLSMSYIYVVGNGRAVKIGKSTRPEGRIGDLDTASHVPLVTYFVGATNGDSGAIETQAHRALSRRRLKGEWFDVPPALAISAVEAAAAMLGLPLMRVDPGDTLGEGQLPPKRAGYAAIWASEAPFVHKLNVTVLRGLAGVMLLGLAAVVGLFAAGVIQFLFSGR